MSTRERVAIEALLRIVNKEGEDVDFKLNSAQQQVDDNWSPRLLIPKARQEGVSMYFLARNTIRCLGKRNTKAVIISHDAESTQRMLLRVKYFLENIKGPAPVIKNSNQNEITFPKTNSMIFIGTAGSRKFGRGDTITDLHCSEVAYWPDPRTLMTGLLQAVPKRTGCISIESTGNGTGNWYHNACMRAASGISSFKLLFLPWHTFPEYTEHPSKALADYTMSNLISDLDEDKMVAQHGLTAGQILWRRRVLLDEMEGDLVQWRQEYPSTLDDCFQATGAGFFNKYQYVPTPEWKKTGQFTHELEGHPRPGYNYVLGADVSAGVGNDRSVQEVFCLETGDQVCEWLSDRTDPDVFAEHIAAVGTRYNEAYVCVESNNHGILTLAALRGIGGTPSIYPMHKVYRTPKGTTRAPRDQVRRVSDLGSRTTHVSKPYILGLLRSALRAEWKIHSPILSSELSTFKEHEDGSLGAAAGCFDDCVIACAMARFARDKAAVTLSDAPRVEDDVRDTSPGNFDAILSELVAKYNDENPFLEEPPIHLLTGTYHANTPH